MKERQMNELRERIDECEKGLVAEMNARLDGNEALMKVHKQIFDQKTKLERAEREMRIARKSMFLRIVDREYIKLFEVGAVRRSIEFYD